MSIIKTGDMVRIKDRSDWPSTPGYRLANSEGDVISVREEEGFVIVRLVKTSVAILKDTALAFRLDAIEKINSTQGD
jgi:hypothetical protein